MRWYMISKQRYSENTAEYGYGDTPAQLHYIRCVVEADTSRKAMAACRKAAPGAVFSGINADWLLSETDGYLSSYTKPADPRLGPNATACHNAALGIHRGE